MYTVTKFFCIQTLSYINIVWFVQIFKNCFIFGCAESLLLCGLFSRCGERGCPAAGAGGLLTAGGVLVGAQALGHTGLSSFSPRAPEHRLSRCGAGTVFCRPSEESLFICVEGTMAHTGNQMMLSQAQMTGHA